MRIIISLCILSIGIAFAQPAKNGAWNVGSLPEKLQKGANAVVREHSETFEILNTGQAVHTYTRAITILNKKGEEDFGRIAIFYDGEFFRLGQVTGGVYDKYGKLQEKVKKKHLIDQSLSGGNEVNDSRVKYVGIRGESYPYTIYYTYTERLEGLMYFPAWKPIREEDLALEKSSLQVIVPKDIDIRSKVIGDVQTTERKVEGEKYVYQWKIDNLSPITHESNAPVHQFPGVLLAPNQFEFGGWSGNSSTWKDFGLFHYKLNEGRDRLSPSMAQKVREMTANASSTREKVDILYKYLQENTRYMSIQLGIGGFQSMAATRVEQTGYGDCKALSYYMKGMLAEVGVPSNACLIFRGNRSVPLQTDFPSTQFNHVMLCVPQPEDTIWLECTNDNVPAGYLGDDDADRYLLLLTNEGGVLRKTPTPDPEDNQQIRTATIKLTETGAASGEVNTAFTGMQQDDIRYMITNRDARHREKWLREEINLPGVEVSKISFQKEVDQPVCNLDYELSARKWAKSSGPRLFLKLHQLESAISVPKKDEDRKLPVLWKFAFQNIDSVFIDLPEGYVIESMGDIETVIERPYGFYKSTIKITDEGDLIFKRMWKLDKCYLQPEEYMEFRKFFMEIRRADQKQIVLNKRS
ncbi:MAG: DUF3857 domain-containing protein [Bacteroidota bacterium]